jgi:hypothetical protein
VPGGEVEDLADRLGELIELLSALLLPHGAAHLDPTALQQRQDRPQAPAVKGDEHRDAQQLIRGRADQVVVGAGLGALTRNDTRRPCKVLEATAVLLAVDRQHGEDKVGLGELRALGVDAHEDVGDELLGDLAVDPHRVKRIVIERREPAERVAQRSFLTVGERLGPRVTQPVDERVDDLPVLRNPQLRDVREVLRIVTDRGVADREYGVAGPKRDADAVLREVLERDRAALHHGIQARQPLLAVDDELSRLVVPRAGANHPVIDIRGVPQHQIADRKPSVHRVEQIADVNALPHERALQLREGQLSTLNVVEQLPQPRGR